VLHCLLHHGRVTRAIGYEKSIIVLACKSREVIIPGTDQDLDTSLDEATQLIVLETNIQAKNSNWSSRWML
jgi:hypothetical protein